MRQDRKTRLLCGILLLMAAIAWLMPLAAAELLFSRGLLFQVERDGEPVGYLFGTMHSEDPRVLALPGPVERAFVESPRLLVEVNMDGASLLASVAAMLLDDGRELRDILDPALYRETVATAARLGLPEAALRYYKPWALAIMLSLPPSETGLFLDLVLYRRALELNKEVAGLETIREQLDLFDSLSEEDQVLLLRDTLNNFEQLPTIFQVLLDRYLDRDLAGLVEINQQLLGGSAEPLVERFQARAVDERNRRMVERLEAPLARGGVFVAVGALHLPGEQGILRLLERRGYRIVRKY
ncbi:TraB/GumN family protein [Sedimenticola hydrogenitrophicus]|uniref:TraB/GumN family protein n=1 Tax=Sedimenticola hydrogenitrophicus TaxID=2967975 RepID=UPI0023B0DC73|nr:TraB/GumN family protein [Sedimenticola hydrogenitrophicus]